MKINWVLPLILFTTILGCASPPPPCSAPAGVASKVDDKHTVFGIALEQPLAIPECPKYGNNSFVDYSYSKQACYKRIGNRAECSPVDSGSVLVQSPVGELPFWVKSVSVRLVNGRVEGVAISTSGISSQEEAYSILVKKYGKPTSRIDLERQNMMGAKFESINASWKVGNISVTFFGAVSRIDSGEIEVLTDIGKAASEAGYKKINEGKKAL